MLGHTPPLSARETHQTASGFALFLWVGYYLEDLLSRDDLIGDVLLNATRCYALLGERENAEETLERAYETQPGPTRKETAFDPHFA